MGTGVGIDPGGILFLDCRPTNVTRTPSSNRLPVTVSGTDSQTNPSDADHTTLAKEGNP